MEFVKDNFLWIISTVVLFVLIANYRWKAFLAARKRKSRFARGEKMEAKAASVLKKKGFEILEYQGQYQHHYLVDGQDRKAKLEVDYVVAKKGRTYLVEVKSGQEATRIENKSTRRQILEYSIAIENDGVFLLDMESEILQKIEFRTTKTNHWSIYYRLALFFLVAGSAASPNWNAKSIFIGLAVLFLTFPKSINNLLGKLE